MSQALEKRVDTSGFASLAALGGGGIGGIGGGSGPNADHNDSASDTASDRPESLGGFIIILDPTPQGLFIYAGPDGTKSIK